MKNCPKCNAELNDDVVFCTECGEALEVVEAPKAEVVAEAPKKKTSLILGIVSLVLTFIPVIGFAYPITALIGLIFGIKEVKAGGKKVGLILNIIALVLFVLSIILGVVLGIFLVMAGGGIIEELLWELGLY